VAVLALIVAAVPARGQLATEFRLAAIDVGSTSETIAVRKYGPGLKIELPGGGYTHVYEDPRARISLFIQCGPDGLVDEMQLVEGLARPYAASLRPRVSLAGLRTGAGLTLGVSRERVIATYGPPQDQREIGGIAWLSWRTDFGHDRRVRLSYQLSMGFKKGRLVRILLHNA
jgi:hypothetical protein